MSLAEWLRGHLFTGFPWNLPGEAWKAGTSPSQAAALVGAYGLTFVTLAIGAAPAAIEPKRGGRGAIAVGAAVGMLALLYVGGAWRLSRASERDTDLIVRVVQPNIPQSAKMTNDAFASIVAEYAGLSAEPATRRPDVVIWPESAVPAAAEELFAPDSWTAQTFARSFTPGQILLAGAYRVDGPRYFNSLVALRRTDEGFAPLARYDKHRLVPFGEYLPLEELMGRLGLKKLAGVGDGFTSGPEPAPIAPEGLPPLQPLICYESLFPGFTGAVGERPAWIVNVSNDAWFGQTSGPWQHLNLASYRAIEAGLPLVRATPTGVSAVVDAYGRTRASMVLGRRGVLDAALPAGIAQTPYSRLREWPFWALCVIGSCCALRRRRKFN
jgi:apolipoprotein N-acyltransferase